MIKIKSFTFNPFQENTYILYDDSKSCIIIDPGCYEDIEKQELTNFISAESLKVEKLVNTHCHIDHVLGNKFIKETYGVELYIHKNDEATLMAVSSYASNYGFQQYEETSADQFLAEGEKLTFGESELDIIYVPGHAPGHVAFISQDDKFCIGGDVLFRGSIGRTDLPGGDLDTLIKSIHNKMFVLPDDIIVYSGHGPTTTIGEEKVTNPFCAIAK
jgi:glyoxylase-like metal-dependent hydrolase (beta-lactamase superfamily II)